MKATGLHVACSGGSQAGQEGPLFAWCAFAWCATCHNHQVNHLSQSCTFSWPRRRSELP